MQAVNQIDIRVPRKGLKGSYSAIVRLTSNTSPMKPKVYVQAASVYINKIMKNESNVHCDFERQHEECHNARIRYMMFGIISHDVPVRSGCGGTVERIDGVVEIRRAVRGRRWNKRSGSLNRWPQGSW